ncbi:MAG: polyamine aminopropyltransferase [Parvularculaceae bacterium]|nr:polyamine aminopropyltransferase [Parvularculaceae bacterium]
MANYLHTINGETWFKEEVTGAIGHALRVDNVLFEGEIDHQHIVVFENEIFGRLFALNGFIQLSTADEFIYHEMVTHVPLFAHGAPKRVLVIGGGDGGAIREVLRHQNVEHVNLVEIEADVVDFAKKWFPTVCQDAFDDPRVTVTITDGAKFVQETAETYDVVIVDSTDPVGPGEVLFTEEFYAGCKRVLNQGGIMVTQCGLPFLQPEELKKAADNQKAAFKNVRFYAITVPAYSGGVMTLGYATDSDETPETSTELGAQIKASDLSFKYYNANVHRAAFQLPEYVAKIVH